jgi:nucleoside-diphosphate-sugar epimerase
VCDDFLRDGHFQVRGTVRDPTNEAKLAPLKKGFGDKYSKLEIVKADLLDAESIDKAVEGCDFVIHVASPFPLSNPADENELIKPAVDGTLNVLKAAHKHKVKRVVVTSSQVSVIMKQHQNRKDTYNEADWSELECLEGYDKSKYLAEKAAWDFVKALPEAERFELSVVAPGLIVGPSIVNDDFTSGQYIGAFMAGSFPQFPKVAFPVVDIRDISIAHLKCIKVKKAAG